MLENLQPILSAIQKEYDVKEEVKKIVEKRLTNYFTQLIKSENGTAPIFSTKTSIKNVTIANGLMSLGGLITSVVSAGIGIPIIILGGYIL